MKRRGLTEDRERRKKVNPGRQKEEDLLNIRGDGPDGEDGAEKVGD